MDKDSPPPPVLTCTDYSCRCCASVTYHTCYVALVVQCLSERIITDNCRQAGGADAMRNNKSGKKDKYEHTKQGSSTH